MDCRSIGDSFFIVRDICDIYVAMLEKTGGHFIVMILRYI